MVTPLILMKLKLAKHIFHEKISSLSPDWYKGNLGSHTWNSDDDTVVIDGHRYIDTYILVECSLNLLLKIKVINEGIMLIIRAHFSELELAILRR